MTPAVNISLILDTSAVLAYADDLRSIHVGEVLAELDDDPDDPQFAVPTICLAEATAQLGDEHMVRLLVQRPTCIVTPTRRGDWPALARDRRLLGRLDLAAAALLAADTGVPILTDEADVYGDEVPVIPIGDM